MYRGSSALLRDYNYMIHKPLIHILFDDENRKLFFCDALEDTKNFLKCLNNTYNKINTYYSNLKNNNGVSMHPSKTLITKILLGVYGCIPAYDRNVTAALKYFNIKTNNFSSLIYSIINDKEFIKQCKEAMTHYPQYTFMKIVDMYLWEIGEKQSGGL